MTEPTRRVRRLRLSPAARVVLLARLFLVAGLALVAIGVALIYPPAGVIAAGLALAGLGAEELLR